MFYIIEQWYFFYLVVFFFFVIYNIMIYKYITYNNVYKYISIIFLDLLIFWQIQL